MKDAHAVPFEVRPPASTSSGTVTGCVDFYVGAVLIGQANVEMTVVKPNDSSDAAEKSDVLGPVAKVRLGVGWGWGPRLGRGMHEREGEVLVFCSLVADDRGTCGYSNLDCALA